MDSSENEKNVHFSKSDYKKTKTFNHIFKIEHEQKDADKLKFKRSSTHFISKMFVPKIRPRKATINPTFLSLNEENRKLNSLNKENKNSKSLNNLLSKEDNVSFSSVSDKNSEEEEKTLNKISTKENKAKLKFLNDNNIKNIKQDLFSSLSNLRKKLHRIKNNSCLLKIKESIDLNPLNLKNRFGLYDNNHFDEGNYINAKDVNKNNNKSSKKKIRSKPSLIFDVLVRASKFNKL